MLMRLVLLSGGSGKRLWPLSNDARSKQFLKILRDSNGKPISMVQRVWQQLTKIGLTDKTVIATGRSQQDIIYSQLGDGILTIIEPERRDTFPAIALAASYMFSQGEVSRQDILIILPVDSFVENNFFVKVQKLEDILLHSGADLAVMGVVPTFPSTKYGYILANQQRFDNGMGATYRWVHSFLEKPNENIAEKLVEQGALWNCGIFAFRLEFMLSKLREMGFSEKYSELLEQYSELPKISFDYEVVEKTEKVVVLDYDEDWKDLGTWNTLTDEIPDTINGRGIISEDSVHTHIINELNIPIVVLGCPNLIVAAGSDGILVTHREASHRVKELVVNLGGRPMYEERRWGWYRVLDYTIYPEGVVVLTKHIALKEGKNLSYQYHQFRREVWTITRGEGEFALDGRLKTVRTGDVLEIPVGAKHGIKATKELEFIEVQSGSQLVEEDIIRLCMSWEDVKKVVKLT
jgi:mannose-1-phosphate guanylyltransferase